MGEWVRAQDRLPEKDTWVMCWFPKHPFREQRLLYMKFFIHAWTEKGIVKEMLRFGCDEGTWEVREISHWYPIPKVPDE